jgi:thiol-disulfide isomerase/thioredoxin
MKLFSITKRSLFSTFWTRVALSALAILGVTAMTTFHHATVLAEFPSANTPSPMKTRSALADEGPMPDLGGALGWLNSEPLNAKSLRGKVVLIDFWTYTCINSLRPLPYLKTWAAKYKDAGLVVIGVHTPEFSFERERPNVEIATREHNVVFPVAIDTDYKIWRAFDNQYWPALYFIDGKGRIRYHYFGEGDYAHEEHVIQELLKENGATGLDESTANVSGEGVEAAPGRNVQSPETYVGYRQAERFSSPERLARHSPKIYSSPANPSLNHWAVSGSWNIAPESAELLAAPGKIMFRFHSRDIHLVLAPAKDGKLIRFKVTLDGAPLGGSHGSDSSPDGAGEVREPRLYQLIRQTGEIKDRTFEIEFLDPGIQAFAFTFG